MNLQMRKMKATVDTSSSGLGLSKQPAVGKGGGGFSIGLNKMDSLMSSDGEADLSWDPRKTVKPAKGGRFGGALQINTGSNAKKNLGGGGGFNSAYGNRDRFNTMANKPKNDNQNITDLFFSKMDSVMGDDLETPNMGLNDRVTDSSNDYFNNNYANTYNAGNKNFGGGLHNFGNNNFRNVNLGYNNNYNNRRATVG